MTPLVSLMALLFLPFFISGDRSGETLAEIEALLSFKQNLSDPAGALTGWNYSSPFAPCDWRGIACYNDRVTELRLPRLQLGGRLSDQIANLRMLRMLSLRFNSFNGTIPASLSKCTLLRAVLLQYNSFSGEFPPDIGNLTSLIILNVAQNNLSGEIPGSLPPNLKYVDFSSNSFAGEIPVGFRNLSQLQTLSLRNNSLTGTLPAEVMGLGNLTTLDLSGNKFSGEIRTMVGNLSGLVVLNLSCNGLWGKIPVSLGNLFRLTTLDLSKQKFSGELPAELLGLPNLQIIALQENMLSGDVPEGLSSLSSLHYLNLSSNFFSGQIPATFGFLMSLTVLSLSENHISGLIPPELGNCSALEILDLRSNNLTGPIPADLSRLSKLNVIDLGKNKLTGEIPEELSECSLLTSLLLDGNHLSGEIPVTLGSRFNNPSAFADNQDLCGKPLMTCDYRTPTRSSKKQRPILLIIFAAIGACLFVLCCCSSILSLLRWRKRLIERAAAEKKQSPARTSSRSSGARTSSRSSGARRSSVDNGGPKLVMFNNKITLAETIEATRQFDEDNVLSRSQFGLLFKACYGDGVVLSIRRLPDGSLAENTFRKEAELLGKVRHRNLTVLRGYYSEQQSLRLLAYDYMPNSNLATLLQEASHQDGGSSSHVLNWPMRHLIAVGIARGLAFLHASNIIHGDINPQHVLFDADFEPHLSDFGLNRLTVATLAEASATVGTLGYVSPEATITGQATKESDVYSFGILLLELLTGKRPMIFTQDEDIVKWVKKQLQSGKITELLEPGLLELDTESSEWEEFLLGIKVGLLCTTADPTHRPNMSDIVFMLEGCRVGADIPSSAAPTSQPSPA